MMRKSLVYFFVTCLILVTTSLPADELQIRLKLPRGVPGESLKLNIFESNFSEIYSDQQLMETHPFGADGTLVVNYTPTEKTRLEIVGPGVLRTSYPWPEDAALPNKEAVFSIPEGAQIQATIVNGETREPISDAIIGPVTLANPPDSFDILQSSYPFFTNSSSQGEILCYGVQSGLDYKAVCWAPGFQQKTVLLNSAAPSEIALIPGGETISGTVLGRKSQQPMPGALINVYSEESNLNFKWRAGEEGKFQIPGIPPGQTQLTVSSKLDGTSQPAEVFVQKGVTPPEWTLFCPEGVTVSGVMQDVETLMGVSGAWLEIAGEGVRTDNLGRFSFPILHGPWPRHLQFEHPEYTFETADQTLENYPINGHDGIDLDQVILKARRIRFLELLGEVEAPSDSTLVLDIFDLGDEEKINTNHRRIQSLPTTLPLKSAGDRLLWLRDGKDISSKLHLIYTAQDQTTTTVNLEIGQSSKLQGMFFDETNPENTKFPPYKIALRTDEEQYGFDVPISSVTTQAEGKFNFPCLPSGWFVLEYQRADQSAVKTETKLYLEQGEVKDIQLAIQQGQSLKGIVVNEDAVPLAQIPLEIYAEKPDGSPYHFQIMSNADGTFIFNDIGGESVNKISVQHHEYKPLFLEDIPLPQSEYMVVVERRGGITVHLDADEYTLTTARAQILQGNLSPAPQGGLHWFSNMVTEDSFKSKDKVTLFPKSTGRMRVAVYAHTEWIVSPAFQWDPTNERKIISLAPNQSASLTVTLPNEDFTDEESSWEAIALNTTLVEGQAETEFAGELSAPNEIAFEQIPAGDYILLINAPNNRTISQAGIALENGQDAKLNVSMEFKTFDLYGEIFEGDDNSPASGCDITLYYADIPESAPIGEESSNSRGEFDFPALEVTHNYTLVIQKGNQQKTFNVIPPKNQGEMLQQFQLPKLVTVQFTPTDELLQRTEKNAQVPIILFPKQGGAPIQLKGSELTNQMEMEVGLYTVVWGEERVGTVEVPDSNRTVNLSLPED